MDNPELQQRFPGLCWSSSRLPHPTRADRNPTIPNSPESGVGIFFRSQFAVRERRCGSSGEVCTPELRESVHSSPSKITSRNLGLILKTLNYGLCCSA